MAETKAALNTIRSAFRKYATRPVPESAQILSGPQAKRAEVLVTSTIRDLTQDNKRRVTTFRSFKNDASAARDDDLEWTTEEKDDYVASYAHEYVEGQRIVFRSCEAAKKPASKRHFVERWSRSSLLDSLEVTAKHGAFYTDSTFGGVSFHAKIPSRLAYIAEAKKPEDETFRKFEYQEEWGELFAEKANPVVVVVDFENRLAENEASEAQDAQSADDGSSDSPSPSDDHKTKVVVMQAPKDTSCGPAVFGPEDDKVIWVATSTKPRRYGAAYCPNRRSSIMYSSYDGSDCQNLTKAYDHARSPLLGTENDLYFLTNRMGGAHFHCSELHRYDFETQQCSLVVAAPKSSTVNGFTGIYTDRLSYIHGDEVITNSFCRSTSCPYSLFTEHGMAKELVPNRKAEDSWAAIGAGKGQLVLCKNAADGAVEVVLHNLASDETVPIAQFAAPSKDVLTTKIITYKDKPYLESILFLPQNTTTATFFGSSSTSKPPLVVFPHGGPHVTTTTTYSAWTATMVELGTAVLCVNYTGSIGFGKEGIESLVGRIGDLDVSDVQFAKDEVLKTGLVDETRVAAMGGSHGGFLTAWLVGKYPNDYKCGVLRNPVIGLASCGAGSDIPDWACAEAGVDYDLDTPPLITSDVYSKLWAASPMSVAENVRAPVLMAVGGKDQRVPQYEGLNWIKFLRSRGHENARYPDDGHSLDSGEAFKHGFEAVACFLKEFL